MPDGPNYEKVFRGMQCLHGGSAEDVKVIKRYLRFFQDSEEFKLYADHYLPMLSEEDRKEFIEEEVKEKKEVEEVKEEPKEVKPKKRGRKPNTVTKS